MKLSDQIKAIHVEGEAIQKEVELLVRAVKRFPKSPDRDFLIDQMVEQFNVDKSVFDQRKIRSSWNAERWIKEEEALKAEMRLWSSAGKHDRAELCRSAAKIARETAEELS